MTAMQATANPGGKIGSAIISPHHIEETVERHDTYESNHGRTSLKAKISSQPDLLHSCVPTSQPQMSTHLNQDCSTPLRPGTAGMLHHTLQPPFCIFSAICPPPLRPLSLWDIASLKSYAHYVL
ncbi:hypothetical protein E2C01_001826 [Portunus trituberculatus]|uniref:Uncharacterized protein n=1 Tax=Portunus trituberculatus TaxID=210409 RepID=A0A5B7CIK3_PORTR|nr:hypothetical protein [Portunus trituberculatus]